MGLIIRQHLILGHDVYFNCCIVLPLNQLHIQYTYRQASINVRVNVGQQQNHGVLHRMVLFLEKLDFFFGPSRPLLEMSNFCLNHSLEKTSRIKHFITIM